MSIAAVLVGLFVYRLGHGPLKAERWVRFPYGLPTSHSINKIKGFMLGAIRAGCRAVQRSGPGSGPLGSQWFINPNFNPNSEVEQSACSADLQSAVFAGLQPAGHPVMRGDQKSAWHLRVETRETVGCKPALPLADTGNFGVWVQSGRMHHDPQFYKSQWPTLAALQTAGSRYASSASGRSFWAPTSTTCARGRA